MLNQLTTDEEALQACQVDFVHYRHSLPGTCVYLIFDPDLGMQSYTFCHYRLLLFVRLAVQ